MESNAERRTLGSQHLFQPAAAGNWINPSYYHLHPAPAQFAHTDGQAGTFYPLNLLFPYPLIGAPASNPVAYNGNNNIGVFQDGNIANNLIVEDNVPGMNDTNSDLLSYSRQFILDYGLVENRHLLDLGILRDDATNLEVKASLPLNLITPNHAKHKETQEQRNHRYWLLIRRQSEPEDLPSIERIASFSLLVKAFRNKLGKVILDHLQHRFVNVLEEIRQERNYTPSTTKQFLTFQMALKELRHSGNDTSLFRDMIQQAFDSTYGLTSSRRTFADQVMRIFRFRYSGSTSIGRKGFVVQFISQKRGDLLSAFSKISKKRGISGLSSTNQRDLRRHHSNLPPSFNGLLGSTSLLSLSSAPPVLPASLLPTEEQHQPSSKESMTSSLPLFSCSPAQRITLSHHTEEQQDPSSKESTTSSSLSLSSSPPVIPITLLRAQQQCEPGSKESMTSSWSPSPNRDILPNSILHAQEQWELSTKESTTSSLSLSSSHPDLPTTLLDSPNLTTGCKVSLQTPEAVLPTGTELDDKYNDCHQVRFCVCF